MAYLAADRIFLPVQYVLFRLGDVTTVLRSHVSLFLSDLTIVAMQSHRFGVRHLTFFHFVVDASILIRKTLVHLFAAWMFFLPLRFSEAVPVSTAINVAAIAKLRGSVRMVFSPFVAWRKFRRLFHNRRRTSSVDGYSISL